MAPRRPGRLWVGLVTASIRMQTSRRIIPRPIWPGGAGMTIAVISLSPLAALAMPDTEAMTQLKTRIAQVYARREALKQDLTARKAPMRAGLARLAELDAELSELDTRYKTLWDAAHSRRPGEEDGLHVGAAGPDHAG